MNKKIVSFLVIYIITYLIISFIRGLGDDKNVKVQNETTTKVNPTVEQTTTVNKDEFYNDYYINAEDYYNSGQYESAIIYLNKIGSDWSEYGKALALMDECKKLGKEEALNEATTYIEAQDYDNAIKTLKESRYSGDVDVIALMADYEKMKPVNLFDVKTIVNEVDEWAFYGVNKKDNVGTVHEDMWQIVANSFGDGESITFMLDGEYTTLKGDLYLSDTSKSTHMWGYLEFQGDGKVIGKTDVLKAGVRPITYEIDVTGVQDLTVVPKYSHAGGWNCLYMYTEGIWLYR